MLTPEVQLVIDEERFLINASEFYNYCKLHGVSSRVHFKSLKSVVLADLLIKNFGMKSYAVARAGEAYCLSKLGSLDVLWAYPLFGEKYWQILMELSKVHNMSVHIESSIQLDQLRSVNKDFTNVQLWLDIDSGMGRNGAYENGVIESIVSMIKTTNPNSYSGLSMYLGQFWNHAQFQNFECQTIEIENKINAAEKILNSYDFAASGVSSAASPIAYKLHLLKSVTEIKLGSRLLSDYSLVANFGLPLSSVAAWVECSLVSVRASSKYVVNVGSKSLGKFAVETVQGSVFGYLPDYPDAIFSVINEELSVIDFTNSKSKPKLGERLKIIPSHGGLALSSFNQFILRSYGKDTIVAIDARGLFL